MKQITYAGTSFVTGTDIADALLTLAAALGGSAATASVRVPALAGDDTVTTVDLVIGPASEIVANVVHGTTDELVDEAAVRDLNVRAEALSRPSAEPATTTDSLPLGWNSPDLDDLGNSL